MGSTPHGERAGWAGTTRAARPRHRRGARALVPVAGVVALALVVSSCVMNGTWALTPTPVVPVQGRAATLTDVSCVSTAWCMAVGEMAGLPMVQVWNGTGWSVAPAPFVTESGWGRMTSVTCGTPTACFARLDHFQDGWFNFDFVVAWDGERWLDVPPGDTVDFSYLDPAPSSCAPDGSCLVVLQRSELTVAWDGETFTTTPYSASSPGFGQVEALDCLAADDCVALREYGLAHWDGAAWSEVAGSSLSDLSITPTPAFACTSASDCVTTGSSWPISTDSGLHWDGTAWRVDPWPTGVFLSEDLACGGPGQCVGLSRSAVLPLSSAWNGDGWYAAPAPPSGVRSLSCVDRWCMAVGSTGTPARPVAATYAWTNP